MPIYYCLLLETLNSSVNVIIYAVFNKKFRILFVEMFCSCFRKKEQLKGPVRTSGRFTLGPILYGPVASPSPIPFGSSSTPSSLLANHLQERLCALLFKGQLISEVIFLGFKSPVKETKKFEGFLPLPLKWVFIILDTFYH